MMRHMDARIPLLLCTLLLCPSMAKAGLIVHSQTGPSVSQASGTASTPDVVPHQDQGNKEHIQQGIPLAGLATLPSPSTGSVVSFAALAYVATPSPAAEFRWQVSTSNDRLPQTPDYRSLLKPS